ncbi:helix-turn-helix domain-containing protein [Winogradskyella aurantia]|uniref:AraC family transcriptional regulator n=1 Tax=Winogradskyella aurantia TaxID=1915063 RepID=A0A265URQ9_9FLAO|nr:helix-turn-helix domain-containing protein [Winogradskyella aurantia]OZV67999.1 AraC family transcriptional regulator [Winogradskyella aurantia]
MSESSSFTDFINQAKALVLNEISNEHFGVSELADAMHMSRSSLLRKIKKQTGLSASQFIRKVRLEEAKALLEETELTVSEISYQVGFSNNSYFIKCFREEFGFPPGETRKRLEEAKEDRGEANDDESSDSLSHKRVESKSEMPRSVISKHKNTIIIAVAGIIIAFISYYYGSSSKDSIQDSDSLKSIAVLPFKNLSADSSNLYFVNGLMEASLGKLQKIEDLRVISRTSVEKYRGSKLSIVDIAKELNVKYIVEGSGQKNKNKVLLNIQLVDATTDAPIWNEQYNYELDDVFELQNTVAKKIALAIEANITPKELARIDKKPTENIEAYDLFLKGYEISQNKTTENLLLAISFYDRATKLDSAFALAYAEKAIAYYYLDEFKIEKKYTDKLNENADKALLYDSKSDISLMAKALYYVSVNEFNLAIPHLEKALEYNPNSAGAVLFLSDLYARALPNTAKYLKYALKGIQLNLEANDSIGKSFIYLHLSNALIQTGFVDEALENINKSISYNPDNEYAPFLKLFIEYAKYKNLEKTTELLEKEWRKDSTRFDILNEAAKLNYFQENYKEAYEYYKILNTLKKEQGIDLYPQENLKMSICYEKMGFEKEAKQFYNRYASYCENDKSIYQPASLAFKYIYDGNNDEAIAQFKEFSNKSNFQYWIVVFLEQDPLIKKLQSHRDYRRTINSINDKFWGDHKDIRKTLKQNKLL